MRRLVVGAVVIAFSSLFLLYVWEKVDLVLVRYTIEQLEKKRISLEREHEVLQFRLAQLTAAERIAQAASDKLDMGPPKPGQVFLVTSKPSVRPDDVMLNEPLRLVQRAPDTQ